MCECETCMKILAELPEKERKCEKHGVPLETADCECYDNHCNPHARGAGCFHGAVICPKCDWEEDNMSDEFDEGLNTTVHISGNSLTSWVAFGNKAEIYRLLEKYLGVTEQGFDEKSEYRMPVRVDIFAAKGKIVIERATIQDKSPFIEKKSDLVCSRCGDAGIVTEKHKGHLFAECVREVCKHKWEFVRTLAEEKKGEP